MTIYFGNVNIGIYNTLFINTLGRRYRRSFSTVNAIELEFESQI